MEEHPNLPYTSPDLEDLASVYFARCFILFRSDPLRRIAFERINLPSLFIRVFETDTGGGGSRFRGIRLHGPRKKAHGYVVHTIQGTSKMVSKGAENGSYYPGNEPRCAVESQPCARLSASRRSPAAPFTFKSGTRHSRQFVIVIKPNVWD